MALPIPRVAPVTSATRLSVDSHISYRSVTPAFIAATVSLINRYRFLDSFAQPTKYVSGPFDKMVHPALRNLAIQFVHKTGADTCLTRLLRIESAFVCSEPSTLLTTGNLGVDQLTSSNARCNT